MCQRETGNVYKKWCGAVCCGMCRCEACNAFLLCCVVCVPWCVVTRFCVCELSLLFFFNADALRSPTLRVPSPTSATMNPTLRGASQPSPDFARLGHTYPVSSSLLQLSSCLNPDVGTLLLSVWSQGTLTPISLRNAKNDVPDFPPFSANQRPKRRRSLFTGGSAKHVSWRSPRWNLHEVN